jgi:Xaa-Pro dipeptidase
MEKDTLYEIITKTGFLVTIAAAAISTVAVFQRKPAKKLGYKTFNIDYTMHKENRARLLLRLSTGLSTNSAVILRGGSELPNYDTDTNHAFRQESFFHYLFGVKEPNCYGVLTLKKAILFVPRMDKDSELWEGPRKSLDWFKSHYLVNACYYTDEINQTLTEHEINNLLILNGTNLDSKLPTALIPTFTGIEDYTRDLDVLHNELVECRVIKTEKELNLLRYINYISSLAHIECMHQIEPGMYEYHSESTFLHTCYTLGGARFHAYTCICGSGANASALHYGHAGSPNIKQLTNGEMFLNDMGCELHCYASDITCTYPIDGKFTPDQKMIYEGVLKSHDAVCGAISEGVKWKDLHILSHRVLIEHFIDTGFFKNGTVDEIFENDLSVYFYPHGLGHFMGLDVHDVGGYEKGQTRETSKLLRYLRCGRELKSGMVITVEPGWYFIEAQIEDLLKSDAKKYVDLDMLERFRGTGGVRIESDIIVRKNGCENMTKVPRTCGEIERVMAGGEWSKEP